MKRATNISYETDGESVELPDSMLLPDHLESDSFADYISDETGFLVLGFDLEESAALDMTPAWRSIMPALILALTDGTPAGRDIATAELMGLAAKLDSLNAKESSK